MIFHIKLLVFGRVRALDYLGHVRAMFSFVMIWYHHVGGDLVSSWFCVSNPLEAEVELYGHLRSRTFGYKVSLGLFHPLIMDEVAPIVWGNLYTFAEFY